MSEQQGSTPRRGRRPGDEAMPEKIMDAAASEFAERGYQAATMRRIAAAAGVDPKLVHYYFGTKEQLFTAMIEAAFRSWGFPEMLADRPADAPDSTGARYLTAVLTMLEHPGMGPAFIGLLRNLGTHEESRRIFVTFVSTQLISRLAPMLPEPLSETRVALAGSQMLGLVFARYILRLPELAELSIPDLAAAIGPTIDRYLIGDIGPA